MHAIEALLARRRIARYITRTPLVRSQWLSEAAGLPVSLKLECLQHQHSFKTRGAFNAVMAAVERGAVAGRQLVTASAGNHGRSLALAARTFSLPLVVFTPVEAPRTKLDAIRGLGATLRAEGRDYDEAERMAKEFAQSTGGLFVSPYNDADVIAGAATIAFEIVEDAPDVDTFVVPIGGGGLIGGVAAVAKSIRPDCRVVGVEAAASCPFQTSVRAGRLVEIVPGPTLADGLAGNPDPDTMTFGLIQQFVDEIVTVSEEDIARSIVHLAATEHLIVEGAGAVGIAAIMAGRVAARGRHVSIIVSGSNIDLAKLAGLLPR
ncbi:MAG TPA: threonine/serine dehydratase [Vicinamibacterales bacterium]|jgi:threonine dehydratase